MVQMIGGANTVLFGSGQAELAAPAHTRRESDPDQSAQADVVVYRLDPRPHSDDTANALVAPNMGELDVCYWLTVWPCRCSFCGVQVLCVTRSAAQLALYFLSCCIRITMDGKFMEGVISSRIGLTALADSGVEHLC